jgi:hypothetical protein
MMAGIIQIFDGLPASAADVDAIELQPHSK